MLWGEVRVPLRDFAFSSYFLGSVFKIFRVYRRSFRMTVSHLYFLKHLFYYCMCMSCTLKACMLWRVELRGHLCESLQSCRPAEPILLFLLHRVLWACGPESFGWFLVCISHLTVGILRWKIMQLHLAFYVSSGKWGLSVSYLLSHLASHWFAVEEIIYSRRLCLFF